jgi:hypothetical protein
VAEPVTAPLRVITGSFVIVTAIEVVPLPDTSPERVIVSFPVMYPELFVSSEMLSLGCNEESAKEP